MSSLQKVFLVIFVMSIAFFATFRLVESPSVWYDEGLYIQTARNVATAHWYGIQLAPGTYLSGQYMSVGFPLIYPLALSFKFFGYSILAARGVMVLFILGFALAGFALMRKLFGTTLALWSLALLAFFPPLYANGKSVLGEVPGLLYLTLALYFIYETRTRSYHRVRSALLAGLFVGLTCVTKPVFLLILPALGIALFAWRNEIREQIGMLWWGIGAFCVPIVTWALTQFSHSDSLLTTLSFYANPYAISDTTLGQTILTNLHNLVTGIGPLFLVGMIGVWTGAIVLRRKSNDQIHLEEWVAYIFCSISLFAYLRTGGFYRYLFPYQAIALLFFPAALARCVAYVRTRYNSGLPIFAAIPAVLLSALILLNGYQLMFDSWVANFYSSTKTASWEQFFDRLPQDRSLFFYNTPEVAIFAHSKNYYQYLSPYRDPKKVQWGRDQLSVVEAGIPDVVVLETRLLEDARAHLQHYVVTDTNNKYTILSKDLRE